MSGHKQELNTIPADMPVWMGESHKALPIDGETTCSQWLPREGESVFCRDDPPNYVSNAKWSFLKAYVYT